MNIEIKNILKEVVNRLIKEYKSEKIILFGSYAHGSYTKDSDIDLLVVIKDASDFKFKHKLISDFPIPIQLVFISSKEFIETKDVIGGIAYPASKYGEILYEES
ncbi:MAG: nucleotidyltransferase domain-containing protein [bacterium]|nr:nucleotidyltransferase domain-containing protein [bacterium]